MPCGSLPGSLRGSCALVSCLLAASACIRARRSAETAPPIPTLAANAVAPTATDPPLAALAAPVAMPESTCPAAMPTPSAPALEPLPAFPAPPRIVLVDEPPYRFLRTRTDDAPPGADDAAQPRRRGRGGRPYHPAPGIVVDVTDAQSGAVAVELQRAARSAGYWPFRRCYEEGLRRDPGLAGKVSLDLAVSPSGVVERANVTAGTLRDESVLLCVGREALHLGLAAQESVSGAKMDVALRTGDAKVPAPAPVAHADELREALRASWPAVEQCYVAELATHPDVGGRLELRFRARSSGEIVEVAEDSETRFADVGVTRCVLGVYRAARLPAACVCSARETSFRYAMHLEARPQNVSPAAK
jgi:hypothetical protein